MQEYGECVALGGGVGGGEQYVQEGVVVGGTANESVVCSRRHDYLPGYRLARGLCGSSALGTTGHRSLNRAEGKARAIWNGG
jgi:hypothetical protein